WKTVRSDAQGALRVEPATTEAAFCARVRAALDIPTDEVRIEAPEGALRARATRRALHPLIEQLRSRAPVLVLVDGFRTESTPPAWFMESLLASVQRAEAPVVLVVAERLEGAVLLSP